MSKKGSLGKTVIAAIITAVAIIVVAGMQIWNNRTQVYRDNKTYQAEITKLNNELINKNAEIGRLETQLIPFKTIALEKYTGPENEALKKLANELEQLKNYVNPILKPIVSASANVEVIIKSDEQGDTRYMSEGGILAFVKNRQILLFTSTKESNVRQNGKGEVVYNGDYQIETNKSALSIGKSVEILKDSDFIQIQFDHMPENSEVLRGNASIVINGDLRLNFEILPQKTQGKAILIKDVEKKFNQLN